MKTTSLRVPLALAAIALLAGCNKLRLGYEYADWLVIYSVEDNFDLDKPQRNRLKEDVDAYFRWNRKQMLPLYADFLSRASDSLKSGFKTQGVDSVYAGFMGLYRTTMAPVVVKAVALLGSLSREQVETFAEKQRKKHLKLRKDFSGARPDQLERRYKKTMEELEDWTGKLNAGQKKQIKAWSYALPWNGDFWLEHKEKLHEKLMAILRKRGPSGDLERFLEDYFLFPEKMRSEAYQARYQESLAKIGAMIARIYGILTPEQKKHVIRQMVSLAQDLRTLNLRN